MSGRHLLDTNIVIALLKNEQNVKNKLSESLQVFVPSIALGELFYGALHSSRVAQHLKEIRDLADHSPILNCDSITAENYGNIKNALKFKGRPLPENDIWIAAIARQYDLILVTRDQHFAEIDSLAIENW
jgi:tRNA(fMet)-specific endonuclease VapC